MSEPFDIKKFLSGLWGAVNYAKVISYAIKGAIILVAVIVIAVSLKSTYDHLFPKKQLPQTQNQTITTEQGGTAHVVNNVYNNPTPKNKIVGVWGGLDKDRGYNINVGFGWLF